VQVPKLSQKGIGLTMKVVRQYLDLQQGLSSGIRLIPLQIRRSAWFGEQDVI